MKMSELINQDHSLLLVISRFGLHLGFGNKTVCEVCTESGIHCDTFLAVVNFLSSGNFEIQEMHADISVSTVIDYLTNAHSYFLDFKLPAIRKKLLEAVTLPGQNSPYGVLFMKFFDEYELEVRRHMDYENKVVFPYVKQLVEGHRDEKYHIGIFEKKHNEIDSKLEELKNILIKYFPDSGNNHLLTEVLFDILQCEIDIESHNKVEDYLFVPTIEAIEKSMAAG